MTKLHIFGLTGVMVITLCGPVEGGEQERRDHASTSACDGLAGAAFGVCNAYCEAACSDANTNPSCELLRKSFRRHTGSSVLPCDSPEPARATETPTSTPAWTATPSPTETSTPAPTATPTATNTPTCAIPTSGLRLWLKADAIAGLADGDPVGLWSDASGNGNDAANLGALDSPTRPTFHTDPVNGQPAVHFDGVDDVLTTLGCASYAAQTIFAVWRKSGDTFGGFDGVIATSFASPRKVNQSNERNGFLGVAGTNAIMAGACGNATGIRIDGVDRDLGDYASCANVGVDLGEATAFHLVTHEQGGSADGPKCWAVGADAYDAAGRYLNGDIAEVLVYETTLSTADRDTVEQCLSDKWLSPSP